MESNSPKLYLEREHRFSVGDLDNLEVSVQRSEEYGGEEYPAQLLDFSRKGVKLLLPISVRFEETVKLDLRFKNTQVCYSGLAQIRHIRADGDHGWQVGCSVQPTIVDEIISHLASSSGKERRRNPRIPASGQGTLYRQGETEATHVQIQNISEGGFCLAVPNQYAVGERVRLEIRDWEDEVKVIDAEIRWQVSTLVGYFVGCSFANVGGFEKLAWCVVETRPELMTINRFLLVAAIITMLIPSAAYMLTHNASPVASAVAFQPPAEIDLADPKPTFIPERDRPQQLETENGLADAKPTEFSNSEIGPGGESAPQNPELSVVRLPVENPIGQVPVGELPLAEVSPVEPSSTQGPSAENPESGNPTMTINTKSSSPKTLAKLDPRARRSMAIAKLPVGLVTLPTSIETMTPMRMWTDDSGVYRIEAAVVRIAGDHVILRSFDDSIKSVPLQRLCAEDVEYLRHISEDSD